MFRQRIVDVVVIAGRFDCGFSTSVSLGEVVEVRVLDANLFDDLTSLIHYCHLCVPFVEALVNHWTASASTVRIRKMKRETVADSYLRSPASQATSFS
ncbi:unknown (plasmid) [Haloarcula marismortui ATCC 43049]|uniref:Uncharacterized protein n=1 Tax=Haloarcula marismortui (strain ATCC 43049 / DSM 3752 / JCM 8966 / VKM B-1809) TaxID=272569 RepID=Q5V7M6_HALMA|nr:unknown [Haloarcula marismortui ATCC 43049]